MLRRIERGRLRRHTKRGRKKREGEGSGNIFYEANLGSKGRGLRRNTQREYRGKTEEKRMLNLTCLDFSNLGKAGPV